VRFLLRYTLIHSLGLSEEAEEDEVGKRQIGRIFLIIFEEAVTMMKKSEKLKLKPDIMNNIALNLKALEFAAFRHRSQVRKGKDRTPYINHPIQVANLLVNEAGEYDPVLISAAILHDVVEDTVNTVGERAELIDQISVIFGEEILSITLEVTDDKTLDKKERKRLQVENASHKSDKAKKLKIADKIMNVRDITDNPPDDWSMQRITEYLEWAEKVVAGLRGVNHKLEELFDECLDNARKKYGDML